MSPPMSARSLRRCFASFSALAGLGAVGLALFASAACTNTTVYDVPDPLQCAVGNGCGIAVCTCGDSSYMIDSACQAGKCVDPNALCNDRCLELGGSKGVVFAKGDTFGAVACNALDDRMFINGCKEGLDLFATTCVEDDTCPNASQTFWQCIVGSAVLSCTKGALHAVGCNATPPLALCTPAQKP